MRLWVLFQEPRNEQSVGDVKVVYPYNPPVAANTKKRMSQCTKELFLFWTLTILTYATMDGGSLLIIQQLRCALREAAK